MNPQYEGQILKIFASIKTFTTQNGGKKEMFMPVPLAATEYVSYLACDAAWFYLPNHSRNIVCSPYQLSFAALQIFMPLLHISENL